MPRNPDCRIGNPDCDCALVPDVTRQFIRREAVPVKPAAVFKYEGPVAQFPSAPKNEVNQPAHYTAHPSGVECITITEHMNFNLGNAVKYIWRASLKGKQRQDMEKAIWYLQRELKRLYP